MCTRVISVLALTVALGATPAFAVAVHELSQQELRQSVTAGRSLSLQNILEGVSRAVPGETVDVRAFDADGIYFHVLVMKPTGQLVSVVVDAATGRIASNGSALAKAIRAAAKSNGGGSAGKSNKGKGKGNAGGNAGGNSGGNGGGGGGGNGGGNGGGGGNGRN